MHSQVEGAAVSRVKKDDYVKIVAVDDGYRYGYISEILDKGFTLVISMFDEGESKVAYDAAHATIHGEESIDYLSLLTEIERRIVPMLSAGYSTKDIATEMTIHPTTVRAHLRTLRLKLHLDDRAQLIALSRALDSMIKKQAEVDEAVKEWQNG